MEKLSLVLWRERELLELLLFKLEVEQLLLASDRLRWLAHAAREVEELLDSIREIDLMRAVAADEAAAEVGLPADPSLDELAHAAGEPWTTMLRDHREAFLALTHEIGEQGESNRSLAAGGYRTLAAGGYRTLASGAEQRRGHARAMGVAGRVDSSTEVLAGGRDRIAEATLHLQLEEAAYQAVLGATARAVGPSLLDFLR